ncbi:unnamed protein product [Gulo gulo]|uniref:Uncharacterized protein n=1 Tax=Gulo gulo TaxID=48420 RepID=A0A9X9Q488_GULGU|nr:unnamed protein product [Gulo gulo]
MSPCVRCWPPARPRPPTWCTAPTPSTSLTSARLASSPDFPDMGWWGTEPPGPQLPWQASGGAHGLWPGCPHPQGPLSIRRPGGRGPDKD